MLLFVRILLWAVWAILLYAFSLWVPTLNAASLDLSSLSMPSTAVLSVLVVVALLEAVVTFLLRHFLLNKPFRRGAFRIEAAKGLVRFVLLHLANWTLAAFVATGGVVFALLSKNSYMYYPFFIAYIILMAANVPRVAPFRNRRAPRGGQAFKTAS